MVAGGPAGEEHSGARRSGENRYRSASTTIRTSSASTTAALPTAAAGGMLRQNDGFARSRV